MRPSLPRLPPIIDLASRMNTRSNWHPGDIQTNITGHFNQTTIWLCHWKSVHETL